MRITTTKLNWIHAGTYLIAHTFKPNVELTIPELVALNIIGYDFKVASHVALSYGMPTAMVVYDSNPDNSNVSNVRMEDGTPIDIGNIHIYGHLFGAADVIVTQGRFTITDVTWNKHLIHDVPYIDPAHPPKSLISDMDVMRYVYLRDFMYHVIKQTIQSSSNLSVDHQDSRVLTPTEITFWWEMKNDDYGALCAVQSDEWTSVWSSYYAPLWVTLLHTKYAYLTEIARDPIGSRLRLEETVIRNEPYEFVGNYVAHLRDGSAIEMVVNWTTENIYHSVCVIVQKVKWVNDDSHKEFTWRDLMVICDVACKQYQGSCDQASSAKSVTLQMHDDSRILQSEPTPWKLDRFIFEATIHADSDVGHTPAHVDFCDEAKVMNTREVPTDDEYYYATWWRSTQLLPYIDPSNLSHLSETKLIDSVALLSDEDNTLMEEYDDITTHTKQ